MIFKRFFDIFISFFGLFVISPVFIIIFFLIKFDSKGSVFFRQDRVGENLKLFKIWKFRTMYSDSDPYGDSPNSEKDIRITRMGKILREYSIDELPQLINVFLGDMSLIGPRPIYQKVADRLSDEQKQRFFTKPGITGLAQVKGRANLTWKERIEFDCFYVNNWSLLFDLKIFFMTLNLLIFKKNVYEISVSHKDHGLENEK
jgi:lipopolysaccharide/colanic/teichoic acid biosynthesis glycosyltransferase